MFIKPFKVKSNNQLKGTERRKLCAEIHNAFTSLSDEQVQHLLPKKEAITVMKIITYHGQQGKVYCVAKVPMFFELEFAAHSTMLFPTVYALWQHPDLLITFTTRSPVIPKLAGGANLMLPGLVLKEPVNLYTFGKLRKGTPVSINTDENKAPIAVGVTALSSEDMYMAGGHGKCVDVYHVIGDTLCHLGKPPQRPDLGPPCIDGDNEIEKQKELVENDTDETSEKLKDAINDLSIDQDSGDDENPEGGEEGEEDSEEDSETENIPEAEEVRIDPIQEMDNLLEYCFLKACKTTLKSAELPILSSNFFKNHLLTACPQDKNIDVKKSKYKKLSVFLAEMKNKGIINTTVLKGVESILSVKFDHPLLRHLVILEERVVSEPPVSNSAVVSECYRVTADVVPILSKFGHEKGDVMKRAQIRECFTEYVKNENLQAGNVLKLDPLLAHILRTKESQLTVSMQDGINKFIGRMTHMHEVKLAGTTLLHTGQLKSIDMRVVLRTGRKKVTLVNNLENFGINSKEFSKECQIIGASATVIEDPERKTPSVLVQGNQVLYVYKLLTEKYQIKKTYIRGLEFAPKKTGSHKK